MVVKVFYFLEMRPSISPLFGLSLLLFFVNRCKGASADLGSFCAPEGSVARKFGQYYTCRSGRLELSGCISEYGTRIPLGQTYFASDFEWACHTMSEYWAQMYPVACWYKGRSFQPDEVYMEKPFWFTCRKSTGSKKKLAEFVVSGCINSYNDEKLAPGKSFQSGSYIFTCRYVNGTMRVEPAACIYDGNEILLGEELPHPNYAFRCQRKNNGFGIEFLTSACMFNGKRYAPGKQYVKNGFVFQCHQQGNRLSHEVVGCVDNGDRWYSNGERWIFGNDTLKYVIECQLNRGSGKSVKAAVQCLYDGKEGTTILNPRCMKKFGSLLLQCQKNPVTGSIQFHIIMHVNKAKEVQALRQGYKYC